MCDPLKLLWSSSETSQWSPSPSSSCKESSLRTLNRVELHDESDWASWMTSSKAIWPGTCPLDWDKNNKLIFFVLGHWDYEFLVQLRLCVCVCVCVCVHARTLNINWCATCTFLSIVSSFWSYQQYIFIYFKFMRQMTIRFSVWCQFAFICTREVK